MNQKECLEYVASNHMDAADLLEERRPGAGKKFRSRVRDLARVLKDVQVAFPDACLYTASGGLLLMLGASHDENGCAQRALIAESASRLIHISDGDF
jgi:hypothetical protein